MPKAEDTSKQMLRKELGTMAGSVEGRPNSIKVISTTTKYNQTRSRAIRFLIVREIRSPGVERRLSGVDEDERSVRMNGNAEMYIDTIRKAR